MKDMNEKIVEEIHKIDEKSIEEKKENMINKSMTEK